MAPGDVDDGAAQHGNAAAQDGDEQDKPAAPLVDSEHGGFCFGRH